MTHAADFRDGSLAKQRREYFRNQVVHVRLCECSSSKRASSIIFHGKNVRATLQPLRHQITKNKMAVTAQSGL